MAHVAISWGGVRLLPVLHQQSAHLRPLGVWVGHVWAPQPPEGVERLSWVLWTAVPIRTLEPAWERVDWSGARGIGQDLHQRLK